MSNIFEDQYKIGEMHELPLTHQLACSKFTARVFEIQAIQAWAGEAGVHLRSEYCTSIKEREGKIISAKVLTYDYKPMMAKHTQPNRQVIISVADLLRKR